MDDSRSYGQRISRNWKIHRNDDVAEDIFQDASEKIYRRFSNLDCGAAYLLRALKNARTDQWRRDTTRKKHEEAAARLRPEVDQRREQLESDLVMDVHAAIAALPPDSREVIHRTFFNGQPLRAVAGELGLSLAGVKSRLRRILQKLETRLKAYKHN